jgi:hypothetical protein
MHLGVVMFGKSMQLRYANDEARNYMARGAWMPCSRTKRT